MTADKLSLHRKLAEIMAEVERIPKNGTAPAVMGGFKFVQVGDAADAIRKALAARKVSMLPTDIEIVGQTEHPTAKGGTMTTVDVRMTWTLTDGESGESAVIQSYGAGGDTGDKYSGKAQTNAMKYALLMGFQLSTGDDPELSDSSDRRQRPPTNGRAPAEVAPPAAMTTHDGGLIGTADIGKGDADFELRQTPDGHSITFRLVSGRDQIKVTAFSPLAEMLGPKRAEVIGQRVTAWGSVGTESWDKIQNGKTVTISYKVLTLERIKGPTFDLAAPEEPEGPPIAKGQEPLFPPDEQAEIDKALAAATT